LYHKAADPSQKYKEGKSSTDNHLEFKQIISRNLIPGKYLLEREKLVKENAWKLDAD
jgi:hypothetical protein